MKSGRDVLSSFWQWQPARTGPMTRITGRFVLLIASAAIAPLVVYGVISVVNLRTGTGETVRTRQPAGRRSGRRANRPVLRLQHTRSALGWLRAARHQSRIMAAVARPQGLRPRFPRVPRDHVLRQRRPDDRDQPRRRATLSVPEAANVGSNGIYIAPLQLDEDSLPQTTIAVRVQASRTGSRLGGRDAGSRRDSGGRSIEVRVGNQGYALLLGEGQRAHRAR